MWPRTTQLARLTTDVFVCVHFAPSSSPCTEELYRAVPQKLETTVIHDTTTNTLDGENCAPMRRLSPRQPELVSYNPTTRGTKKMCERSGGAGGSRHIHPAMWLFALMVNSRCPMLWPTNVEQAANMQQSHVCVLCPLSHPRSLFGGTCPPEYLREIVSQPKRCCFLLAKNNLINYGLNDCTHDKCYLTTVAATDRLALDPRWRSAIKFAE